MSAGTEITLWLPGLWGHFSGVALQPPQTLALDTLLRRGSPLPPHPSGDPLLVLAQAFGWRGDDATALPWGPWLALAERGEWPPEDDAAFAAAAPVYLRPAMDHAVAIGVPPIPLEPVEAQVLAAALNVHLGDSGSPWRFKALRSGRWLLELGNAESQPELALQWGTHPLTAVENRDLRGLLTRDRTVARLQAECEMVLHAHELNARREADGTAPINGLWLWGAATLAQARWLPRRQLREAWGDLPELRGLALAAETPVRPLTTTAEPLLRQLPPGPVLVALDAAWLPARFDDYAGWSAAVTQLDALWLVPLWRALRSGLIKRLTLLAGAAGGVTLTPADAWALWRRRPGLKARLETPLAGAPPR